MCSIFLSLSLSPILSPTSPVSPTESYERQLKLIVQWNKKSLLLDHLRDGKVHHTHTDASPPLPSSLSFSQTNSHKKPLSHSLSLSLSLSLSFPPSLSQATSSKYASALNPALHNSLLLDRPNLAEILLNYGAQLNSVNLWALCDAMDRDVTESFEEILGGKFEESVSQDGLKEREKGRGREKEKEKGKGKEVAGPSSESSRSASMWTKVQASFAENTPRKWTWKFIALLNALCPGRHTLSLSLSLSIYLSIFSFFLLTITIFSQATLTPTAPGSRQLRQT